MGEIGIVELKALVVEATTNLLKLPEGYLTDVCATGPVSG